MLSLFIPMVEFRVSRGQTTLFYPYRTQVGCMASTEPRPPLTSSVGEPRYPLGLGVP